jgi:hypothetical protein
VSRALVGNVEWQRAGFSEGCIVIKASSSRARVVSNFGGCAAIDPVDQIRLHTRSDPKRRPARTSAGARPSAVARTFTEQWQSDLRSCMRAMDSTLAHLLRSIAEGEVLTARSEARCLAKQAHTLDALIVPSPDVIA